MKAVRIHNHGDISELKWESIPRPRLNKSGDDILVRIVASSINHLDIWVRKGIPGVPLPLILGSDGAGIVESCGNKVSEFNPGDEVIVQPLTFCGTCYQCLNGLENYCSKMGILGKTMNGTQCEYLKLNSFQLRQKPPHLSFPDAAAFSLVTQTAYAMLVKRAKIKPGETVFIWGAGSGVGSMAIQIAHYFGCDVYAAAGTDEKVCMAKKLGADEIIDSSKENVSESLQKLTVAGPDVIIDTAGGIETSIKATEWVRSGGRVVLVAIYTSTPKYDFNTIVAKEIQVIGSLGYHINDVKAAINLIAQKKVLTKPLISEIIGINRVLSYGYPKMLAESKDIFRILLVKPILAPRVFVSTTKYFAFGRLDCENCQK